MALMLPVAWPTSAQVLLTDVQLLEGPWEYTSPSGIKGIFIKVETAVINGTVAPMIDWQTVSICVYHRPHGQGEDTHCFAPPAHNRFDQMLGRGGEENYTTDLKNLRLVIHYNIDLELSFDAAAKHWAGTWSERGEQGAVILERPQSRRWRNAVGVTVAPAEARKVPGQLIRPIYKDGGSRQRIYAKKP